MAEYERKVGVMQFVSGLPRRYKVAFAVTVSTTLVTGGLDAVALALVVPLIDFMVNTGGDADLSRVSGWMKSAFDAIGVPFSLGWVLAAVLFMMSLRAIAVLLQSWSSSHFQSWYEADLRIHGHASIMGARWPFFLRQRTGDVVNMLTEESRRAGVAFGYLNGTVASSVNILIYAGAACAVSWQLTLVTLGATLALMASYGILNRFAKKLGERASQANSEVMSEIGEGISAAKIVKSEALEEWSTRRVERVVARRARIEVLSGVNVGMFAATVELAFIGLLLGGLLLGTRVMNLPASTVLLFALLFFRLSQRTRTLQTTILNTSRYLPATDVVRKITGDARREAETVGGKRFERLEHGIEFENVSFTYENGKPVLRGVPLVIPAGSMVALVGRSGVGKTSIIDLTIGLLRPTEGRVLLDGEPLESYDKNSWRSRLAYVSQETILFHDSVYGNIAWGREGASEAEVHAAARLAQADEFIRELPDGYGTVIGDRGMRLSGGQRQRLALARALLRNPELLILDEATSELDSEAEAKIQAALEDIRGRTTILMAAHRLSTITSADRIYMLEAGQIAESGTAGELFAREGAFHRFYHQAWGPERKGTDGGPGRGSSQVGT